MSEGPVQKLLSAILLSAIKKRAHVVRLSHLPSVVYFDYLDGTTQEELRPPQKIGWPMLQELCALSGATLAAPAIFALDVRESRYWFRATVSSGDELFRIELLPPRDPYRS